MSIWYDGTGCVLYNDFFKRVSIYDFEFEFLKFFIFEIDFLPLYVFVSGEISIGSQNLNSHHSFGMTYKIKKDNLQKKINNFFHNFNLLCTHFVWTPGCTGVTTYWSSFGSGIWPLMK